MTPEVLERLIVILQGDDTQLRRILNQVERESRQTGAQVRRNLDFRDIGANLTGLAGGGGILYALREMAREATVTEANVRSFNNTVARAGLDQQETAGRISRLAGEFGLLDSQVQQAATPLIKAGVEAGVAEEAIRALAASSGLAGANIAEATVSGAQGISTLRSELLETSGITVNASQTYESYAASIGKATSELTDAERATAFALGVIREATPDVEDFAESFGDVAQSQADLARTSAEFRREIGAIASEGLVPLNNVLSETFDWFNSLPEGAQRTAIAMVAAGASAIVFHRQDATLPGWEPPTARTYGSGYWQQLTKG